MMTVGGSDPKRDGLPFAACGEPPNPPGPPGLDAPTIPPRWDGCPATPPLPWSLPSAPALLGGSGLLRISFRFEVEDVGVRTGDWLEPSRAELDDGDAVPSLESLFFFDDLFGSLPRDS